MLRPRRRLAALRRPSPQPLPAEPSSDNPGRPPNSATGDSDRALTGTVIRASNRCAYYRRFGLLPLVGSRSEFLFDKSQTYLVVGHAL